LEDSFNVLVNVPRLDSDLFGDCPQGVSPLSQLGHLFPIEDRATDDVARRPAIPAPGSALGPHPGVAES
jgi:hypothetical protein